MEDTLVLLNQRYQQSALHQGERNSVYTLLIFDT